MTHRLRQYLDHLGDLALEVRGDPDTPVSGATADSREVKPGGLFVAIPGQKIDGATFIPAALSAGAAIVAAAQPVELPPGVPFILVRDPYRAAGRIAEVAWDFPARQLRLHGVTGTKGKTTTAYLLRAIFRSAGLRTGMIGTVEYDTGTGVPREADRTTPTPFLLQALFRDMVNNQVTDAVLEVSSHALDQHRPGTVPFAGGLFTNLTGDHMDYHLTDENYFAAKRRLFTEYLPAGAPAVINVDDAKGVELARELAVLPGGPRVLPYGRHPDGAAACIREVRTSIGSTCFRLEFDGRERVFASPLNGMFNVYNLAGAVTYALAWGVPEDRIRIALTTCIGAPGRLQPVTSSDGRFTAFVDYAHTDDSLKNVLSTLRGLNPRRLIVLFGCGGERDVTKRPRMGAVAAEFADRILLTSDNPRGENPDAILAGIRAGIPAGCACEVIPNRREAIRAAVSDLTAEDVLILAGKGHESYQEICGVKYPFNDVTELRLALDRLVKG